jgi:ankyrin repeat protein
MPFNVRGYFHNFIFLTSVLLTVSSTYAQENTNDIWEAAATGDITRLDEIVKNDPNKINAPDTSGSTPLHHAAWTGQIETINWLISNNADIDSQNNLQWTPLHWATRNGQTQSVKLLLEYNAKVNIQGNLNQTTLHLAAKHNLEKLVTILLTAKANPNKPDIFGQTPVHIAALENYTPILINLLENGGKIEVETIWGATPLSAAAARGRTSAVTALLIRNANVNHRTNLGWTPLFSSVVGKHDSTTALLLKNGADINVVTEPGNTLLHADASSGMNDIITELLELSFDINSEDAGGRTPLDYAKDNLWDKTVILIKSKGGMTGSKLTLHHAAFSGKLEMFENLINDKADISQRDDWHLPPRNWTPLHYAAAGGNLDAITRLIDLGSDIRTIDYLGRTPRIIAIENRQTKAVELLKKWEYSPKITKISHAGQMHFEVVGIAGTECEIEASTDLKSWTIISTVKLENGIGKFFDSRKALMPKCFYRAKNID